MRVRKLLLPLALASCLLLGSGCASARTEAAGEARLLDTGDLGKSTTYRLREMAPDDLAHTASLSVSENWQLVKSIRTGSELRLKEICVSRGQSVEAGDPIAVLEGLGSHGAFAGVDARPATQVVEAKSLQCKLPAALILNVCQ